MKDIHIDSDFIRKNRIPILIYTPEWIQLFSNFKSRSMEKTVSKLEGLLSKQKSLEQEQKDLERRKKVLINKILHISNELNESKNQAFVGPLEEAQNEILQINERLPQILDELHTLYEDIDQLNAILLKETVKRTYELINENEQGLESVQREINRLRETIMELIQKKVDMEERVKRLYSYLHDIVGGDEMEVMDEEMLEANNIDKNEILR
ncbi:hypothetical protein SAMN02745176_02004 [Lutispora thermophila DSM 19022]|uniref:Uncharacterized protein n=1 Tax=Lutispora thermophila DSM 19022 TaxID=1122184 RepID=A0A1M6FJX7_9FIRM|nr:hypothetical protein SAMN02745176_02004 [Lutispora thermophila DSM 19022]